MVNSKTKILFLLTVIVGLLTAWSVTTYLTGLSRAALAEPMASVVVVQQKISQGTKLTPEMVKTVQLPAKYIKANFIQQSKKAVGNFATVDLWPEQALMREQLTDSESANELTFRIPQGKRAITVGVNAISGVAGLVKPGNRIDILFYYTNPTNPDQSKVKTILQQVDVLGVGSEMQKKEGPQVVEHFTLALSPHDVQVLYLAENTGKLKMVLRSADDKVQVKLNPIDINYLMSLNS